jgi:hypothetical protein
MALSLMPRSELQHFVDTICWISALTPEDTQMDGKLFCFCSVSPTALKGIDILLLKRKSLSARLPYMSFYIAFSNFTYQIFLPFSSLDRHLIGSTIQMHRLPALHESLDHVTYTVEDLSSNVLQKDEQDTLYFSFSGNLK